MGYIIGVIILLVLGGVGFGVGKFAYEYGKSEEVERRGEGFAWRLGGNIVRYASLGVFGLIFVIVTIASTIHMVDAGHVGIVYTFGSITSQTGDGLVVTWPWQGLKEASVQVQTLAFMDPESFNKLENRQNVTHVGTELSSFSTETQNVYIDAILRIKVTDDEVQGLYREVGPNYVDKLVPGQIAQVFKDETVKFAAVDVAPNREKIRHAVEQRLDAELDRFSITVDALLIENISFDQGFEDAILAKQQATQEALKQQELVKAREFEAQQKAAEAQGTANKLRIEAEGQSAANSLVNQSLTPQLIQFQAIQKLNDNVQIMILPSNANPLFNVSDLLVPSQGSP
jgi:regulator of protease activity HflC (stomatin/prohibitin superfamily)